MQKNKNLDDILTGAIAVMNCKQLIQFCLHIIENSDNETLREKTKAQLLKIGESIDEALNNNNNFINN